MTQNHVIDALRRQLERFMPSDMWRHEITVKDGIANVDSTYLEPIETIYFTLNLEEETE